MGQEMTEPPSPAMKVRRFVRPMGIQISSRAGPPYHGEADGLTSSLALHHPGRSRRARVLDLDPIREAPGSIRPIAPLGDDAFFTHARSDLNLWLG